MNIVYCSAEVAPFSKAGGLGDVAQSFPVELAKLNENVIVITPYYSLIDRKHHLDLVSERVEFKFGEKKEHFQLYKAQLAKSTVTVYFVKHSYLYRDGIYVSESGEPYPDSAMRFIFFSRAIFEVLKSVNFQPDIIHSNDWHTALVPYYLKKVFNSDPFFRATKAVFTIHNIGYQGVFEPSEIKESAIPSLDIPDFLMWGKINLMRVGILYADIITTVSETYANEIQTKEYGYGLEEVIRARSQDLYGVLNGVNYDIWNPAVDPYIPANYSVENLEGKAICKSKLQEKLGLEQSSVPLVAIISRIDYQKGLELVLEIFDDMMSLDAQFVLLGTGDKKLEDAFVKKGNAYGSQCSINIEFNNTLAHQIEAGADIFLMPSRYEPCGLNQIYSMIYGTVPVVRKTGGLADTVIDYFSDPANSTGFVFEHFDRNEFFDAVSKAVNLYNTNPDEWLKLQLRGMSRDFSWRKTALKMLELYKNAQKED